MGRAAVRAPAGARKTARSRPRPRAKRSASADFDFKGLRSLIAKDRVGRRWAALTLASLGWSTASIKSKLPGICSKAVKTWATRLKTGRGLEMNKRSRAPTLSPQALRAVQTDLTSGGSGMRKHKSLRRSYSSLKASGAITKGRESVRRALKRSGWAPQTVDKRLPLTVATKRTRLRFTRAEGRRIASNTSFSDSKRFQATPTRGSNSGLAWAPKGAPLSRATHQSSSVAAHVYGAVTRYGATPLYAATGTSGGLAAVDQAPGGRAAIALAPSRGVTAQEYRFLLDGGAGVGMLPATAAIFRQHQVHNWRWQQDGARAHTVAATPSGRLTRALITSSATLVEPWPAHSPDLSPIEKAWSAVEDHLHVHETWHDHATFLAAIRRSWAAVVTPAYCMKLFGGLRATYAACSAKNGAEVSGWGRRAK